MDTSAINQFVNLLEKELLPKLDLVSVFPHDPVQVRHLPRPWILLGAGNYAAVFTHPDYPELAVKIYAHGRPGLEEEREVYRRLGSHPAFSECFHTSDDCLVLKRLHGITLYDCLQRGIPIPKRVITDIDHALDYARDRGLFPHDIHGRNVMMWENRGYVVDVSDFLHQEVCSKWDNLKRAYYWFYRPFLSPLGLRVPYSVLDVVRKVYRKISNLSKFLHQRYKRLRGRKR